MEKEIKIDSKDHFIPHPEIFIHQENFGYKITF